MERHYVGIDLHRRRSVIFTMDGDGQRLGCKRIANDPMVLVEAVTEFGPMPEVVIEATYGWYWAVELLREEGMNVHLAHPAGNDWGKRRVKNDERDARDLADLLRLGRLAEAWIAPKEIRELRELVRYRYKLVNLRTGLKAQVHAVMAKEGVLPALGEMFGPGGNAQLDAMDLAESYGVRVRSLRDLIAVYDAEVAKLERDIHRRLKGDPGYEAIQVIPGVGRVLGAIFVAEIGDVTRFKSPEALSSWAGLAPRHHESDTKVIRGQITKMGSKMVRWAAIEAVSGRRGGTKLRQDFHAICERRGKYKARAAVARKLLTLVYYGLRDKEIRCLAEEAS
jgi:transposase